MIALQHDGGPSSVLQCQSSAQSPWGQPILALNMSKWFWTNNTRQSADSSTKPLPDPELDLEALLQDGVGGWLEEAVCSIRILYVGHSKTQLHGVQLSAGLPQPGLYSLLVRSALVSVPTVHFAKEHAGGISFQAPGVIIFLFMSNIFTGELHWSIIPGFSIMLAASAASSCPHSPPPPFTKWIHLPAAQQHPAPPPRSVSICNNRVTPWQQSQCEIPV